MQENTPKIEIHGSPYVENLPKSFLLELLAEIKKMQNQPVEEDP